VANTGPIEAGPKPKRLTDERTLLVSNPHFTFERIELAPGSAFSLQAEREIWLVVINGSARAGKLGVAIGDAVFAQSDNVELQAGPDGMVGLVAYAAVRGPDARRHAKQDTSDAGEPEEMQVPTALTSTKAAPVCGYADTPQ
jgi:mannose-6-phosphate isomerase